MPVRISERNRRGERMWMVVVYVLRCAAPPVCLSPILLLENTKSGSAYCLLVVLCMWLLRLLPLPVSACLLSLLLLSLVGAEAQEDEAVRGFGVDSVLLIASLSLFVAVDSTSLLLRTALWLLGVSGARLRPLAFTFMTASFLGALVLPDFLVALVLSSVLEKAVLHLRSKFVSQQFRAPSQCRTPQRRPTLSATHYERLLQEMDSNLQRKIKSSSPVQKASAWTAASSRGRSEHRSLHKMASLMSDICGKVACGVTWIPAGFGTPGSHSPSATPPLCVDEPPSAATSPTPTTAPAKSSPSTSTSSPSDQPLRSSLPVTPRKPSPRRKIRRSSCPPVAERDITIEQTTRLAERWSSSAHRKSGHEPWSPGQIPPRTYSRLSPVSAHRGGFTAPRSSIVVPGDAGFEERESGSVNAECATPHRRRGQRASSLQQMNFGDTTEANSSRKQGVPWNYSREDLTRISHRNSEVIDALSIEKMCFTIRKTFIIGVVMTSTLASACAKSTRALIATGIPRYSFKASALVVLPMALCTTILCWAALFFAYLSEYDELALRSSALAIHDVMQAKLSSMGRIQGQELLCFAVCAITTLSCSAMLFSNQADLVTCVTLAALALVFGVPSVSVVPLRDVIAQLPWNIILIHTGSLWLSAAIRDSGLAVWLVSTYTKERFRDLKDIWQLLVILAVASLVNEGGQEPSTLSAQLVPIISDMGLEIRGNPLYFSVPVAAACYLPVMTPFCHLGLTFIYEHTAASFGEMALLGLFLKVVTTIALTLSSSAFFSFHSEFENDTQTPFITL